MSGIPRQVRADGAACNALFLLVCLLAPFPRSSFTFLSLLFHSFRRHNDGHESRRRCACGHVCFGVHRLACLAISALPLSFFPLFSGGWTGRGCAFVWDRTGGWFGAFWMRRSSLGEAVDGKGLEFGKRREWEVGGRE